MATHDEIRAQVETRIRSQITTMLQNREQSKTLCPSEVVRALSDDLPDGWRAEMPTVRNVAFDMALHGSLTILQKGKLIPPTQLQSIKGPIRIGHASNHDHTTLPK